ncbi:MAG: hypothetical protein ISS78_09475 [Phycisphaerae bacterium]|nr:hypothetical protein [Phycisphaerae bacterium]
MNTDNLPGELPEDATPEEAEAWLRQYAAAVGYEMSWNSDATEYNVAGLTTGTKIEEATQRLNEAEPSRRRAVAILTKAERNPGQIFEDAQDKTPGPSTGDGHPGWAAISKATLDGPQAMKLPTADRMLALMGHISAIFSSLEFEMAEILAKLIDTTTGAIAGSYVAEQFTLSKTIDLINKVMPCRFPPSDNSFAQLTDLCNSVDQVRRQRNFFVHGRWNLEPKLLAAGKVVVQDKKWKLIKGGLGARRLQDHMFSEPELIGLRDTIAQLDGDANRLFNELDPARFRKIRPPSPLHPDKG